MEKIIYSGLAGFVGLCSGLSYATAGLTQEVGVSSNEIEEVVVTARKRSERLQDVPISMTTFGEGDLNIRYLVG